MGRIIQAEAELKVRWPKKTPYCHTCGKHRSAYWCDYPTTENKGGICAKPLCQTCAVTVGGQMKFCPDHGPGFKARVF